MITYYQLLLNLYEATKEDYVERLRDATDPAGEVGEEPEDIIQAAHKEHGPKFAADLKHGAQTMHFPRPGRSSGMDPLAFPSRTTRVTKTGKANKQDIEALKTRIRGRLQK